VTITEVLKTPRNYVMSARVADRVLIAAAPQPVPAPDSAPVPTGPPQPQPVQEPRAPEPVVVVPASPDPQPAPPLPPAPTAVPPPSVSPARTIPGRAEYTALVEFGNLDFPAALRILDLVPAPPRPGLVRATRAFILETAEYVTGLEEFTQSFALDRPMLLTQVSLALQKFGGRQGEVWLELSPDHGGRPGPRLADSRRLQAGTLLNHGGYRWVVFDFGRDESGPVLPAGRYWVVLRHTDDGIFNWFFSPGNAFGEPDDTRSRASGASDWSNILTYRFNYRVTGLAKP